MLPASAIAPIISSFGLRPPGEITGPDFAPGLQTLQPSLPLKGPSEAGLTQPAGETSFSNILGRMVEEVNNHQIAANDAVAALQSGQSVSLHQAVIAMEEANLSFQLMVEVRNKLLESYQELMRMQV
jgi:flagellar hook-basal body complex protein FliE